MGRVFKLDCKYIYRARCIDFPSARCRILGFQASILRGLVSNPSLWGPLSHKIELLLLPRRKPCHLEACKTIRVGEASMAPEATILSEAALDTNQHCNPQSEPHFPLSPLDSSPQSQQIRPAMPLSLNPNPRLSFQASITRGLVLNPSIWGPLSHKTGLLLSPRMEPCYLKLRKTPRVGKNLHGPLRTPPHLAAPVDTNSSLSHRLTPALTSDPGELASASAYQACIALGPIPKPSLGFQTSVPRYLAHKPSRLGIQKPHHSCCELPQTPSHYQNKVYKETYWVL